MYSTCMCNAQQVLYIQLTNDPIIIPNTVKHVTIITIIIIIIIIIIHM